ncbi:probable ubiquitin-like-specific protease 2B [Brachypodium distachyon]|uniref:probable ubiquitin-like-specific protease 2B n=1 Tax=Brachypodium distachyon TaxID=15368 RepID=UPI000234F195|nr:probable ubiquitin-like-specific protease 2B [Brachypodium distachyon]|eukprot:XP_003576171.1 probable ubiquitin-like-specific protease 2B [Brachypodium distachyon]
MHINIGSSRGCTNKDELDTETFEIFMEDVWTSIDPEEKINYEYFDSLLFYIYTIGNDKNKSDVLERIKDKKIFSKQYVFVPIILWGHWNLLVLSNFGKKNYLGTKKGPRMLLLDSLKTTNPTRLRSAISKFIVDILKIQEREELQQFIKEVKLEIPEVPQQSGRMDCGIYVLYFVFCILFVEKLGEDLSQLEGVTR